MEQGQQSEYRVPEGEFTIKVDFEKREKETFFTSNFQKISPIHCGYPSHWWRMHPWCDKVDLTPGERAMLLMHFDRKIKTEEVLKEMDRLGYRPAIHLELFEFFWSHCLSIYQFPTVALGSSIYIAPRSWTKVGDVQSQVATIGLDSEGNRMVGQDDFDADWFTSVRFLAVRKD